MAGTKRTRGERSPAPENAVPRRTGRPTAYRPEYCERIVELASEGYSLAAVAGKLGVARDTLLAWTYDHPEFKEATARAKAIRTAWYEDRAREVMKNGGTGAQATLIAFGLRNHAPEDYADTSRHEHSGPGGGPIPIARIERVVIDPAATTEN